MKQLRRIRKACRTNGRRLIDGARELRSFALPVRAVLGLEAALALIAAVAVPAWVWRAATSFDPATAEPPWGLLVAAPAAGAATYLVRQLRPLAAARRWHGVAIRRLDERWSKT